MGTSLQESAPDIITYTSMAFSVIALLGVIFVFVSYISHKRLQTFTFRMILWMSIFDSVIIISAMFGPLGSLSMQSGAESLTILCKIQAGCVQFGILASLLWILMFGIHLIRITDISAKADSVHTNFSYIIYLLITISLPLISVYYIFDHNLVGVSGSDEWCWIDEYYIDQYAWKLLYLAVAIIIFICVVLYFFMRVRLKVLSTQNIDSPLLKQSKRRFIRAVAGGLSAYLGAPMVAWVPAHFNWICTQLGLESESHVISWYILSAILHGILHMGIFVCGIGLVRQSWSTCCDNSPRNHRSLRESEQFYMELV